MSEHRATVAWQRSGEFRYETYSRNHLVSFDGITVPGTAAPENIPATARGASGVDPEQAFAAPSEAEHRALHERAHEKCFIANSVKSEVRIEPRLA